MTEEQLRLLSTRMAVRPPHWYCVRVYYETEDGRLLCTDSDAMHMEKCTALMLSLFADQIPCELLGWDDSYADNPTPVFSVLPLAICSRRAEADYVHFPHTSAAPTMREITESEIEKDPTYGTVGDRLRNLEIE